MRLSPGNTLVEDGGREGVHYGGDQELSSRSYDSRRWRQKKGVWMVSPRVLTRLVPRDQPRDWKVHCVISTTLGDDACIT